MSRITRASAKLKRVSSAILGGTQPLSEVDTPPPHLLLGVTFTFVREYCEEHHLCAEGITSRDVGARILELTRTTKRSVAEMCAKKKARTGEPAVGPAEIFVSHAHSCSFVKMLDAVEAYLATHGLDPNTTYLWIDLFSLRQHAINTEVVHIAAIERQVGLVVLVVDPWDKPVALTRVWCIYEMVHALDDSAHLDLALPREQHDRLRAALDRDREDVERLITEFDVREVKVPNTRERHAILGIIERACARKDDPRGKESGGGVQIFNERTHDIMRSLVEDTIAQRQRHPSRSPASTERRKISAALDEVKGKLGPFLPGMAMLAWAQ